MSPQSSGRGVSSYPGEVAFGGVRLGTGLRVRERLDMACDGKFAQSTPKQLVTIVQSRRRYLRAILRMPRCKPGDIAHEFFGRCIVSNAGVDMLTVLI